MGKIKEQLADEAEKEKEVAQIQEKKKTPVQTAPIFIKEVKAAAPVIAKVKAVEPVKNVHPTPRDEISITLIPGQGAEVKLVMNKKGMKAFYEWSANGGKVNFDTHGEGLEGSISYEKGRSVSDDKGELISAFAGNHGWYWRNRTMSNVTVTLKTWGDYQRMVRVE